ncbi:recombinase family protein [Brucella grignonensis]|uniref:Resolvase, N terminal domain protein n=1 Tax=Brucella grignonensis TaxID=94627 RepID=A0A256FCD5_9HYPH|nr:recombinase family protein [Brucella grignonensis]OYR12537.1 resolvase, N terminal domain protein [Brucella grignonensis]
MQPSSENDRYARVSTRDQTHALQLDALRKAECERIFEETASGAQRARPQLAAALDYVRKGDTIVVWKLDRLARSIKQLIETVEHLERREIGFRSLTEQIDTTTAGGRLIFHIFGALAEFERSIIRERSRAGLEAARARGRIGGRPRALSPTDLIAAKAMLTNRDITVVEVARRLSVSPATLYRHLPGGRTAAELE